MAAEQRFCERHHRPAVALRVRLLPDGSRETEYLREIDLAEELMPGARPLPRTIQRMVEKEVRVEADDGELHFESDGAGSRREAAQREAVRH